MFFVLFGTQRYVVQKNYNWIDVTPFESLLNKYQHQDVCLIYTGSSDLANKFENLLSKLNKEKNPVHESPVEAGI
jgi:hypothetical protein